MIYRNFRGKAHEDGRWITGDLVHSSFGVGIRHFAEIKGIKRGVTTFVDPDTLSLCSGLTACGQDVYEGDIIRFHIDHTTEFWTAVVRFGWHDTYEYGWYLASIRDTMFTKRIGAWLGENAAFGSTAAVIGNVWDNPEMMEGTG